MTDWTPLITVLVTAGLTGAGVVAYRHPEAYSRLYYMALILLWIIFLSVMIHDAAITKAVYAAAQLASFTDNKALNELIDSESWGSTGMFVGIIGTFFVLSFLEIMPVLGITHKVVDHKMHPKLHKERAEKRDD